MCGVKRTSDVRGILAMTSRIVYSFSRLRDSGSQGPWDSGSQRLGVFRSRGLRVSGSQGLRVSWSLGLLVYWSMGLWVYGSGTLGLFSCCFSKFSRISCELLARNTSL